MSVSVSDRTVYVLVTSRDQLGPREINADRSLGVFVTKGEVSMVGEIDNLTIRRYPDIDEQLLSRGWIEYGRLWYLLKHLADPNHHGVIDVDTATKTLVTVTKRRSVYWMNQILKCSEHYSKDSKRLTYGFIQLLSKPPVVRLQLLGPASVLRLLGIRRMNLAPVDMPIIALLGTKTEVKQSYYECTTRARYANRLVSRHNRAVDLGVSKSTTHRYDKALCLDVYENWLPYHDCDNKLFTDNNRQKLREIAFNISMFRETPSRYQVVPTNSLSLPILKAIGKGQRLEKYIIVEQLPSTYKQHAEPNLRAKESVNRKLHTSAETATTFIYDERNSGRSCSQAEKHKPITLLPDAELTGGRRLWVHAQPRRKK